MIAVRSRVPIALVVFALATFGLRFAYDTREHSLQAQLDEQARLQAQAELREVIELARAAHQKLESVQRSLDELDMKVARAVSDVANAKERADIVAAQNHLAELQQEQAEMRRRVAEAKEVIARFERVCPLHISEECKANPLGKGCS